MLEREHRRCGGVLEVDERREPTSAADELRAELTERVRRLGYDGTLDQMVNAWAGSENQEERVDRVERIDPVVLEEPRVR